MIRPELPIAPPRPATGRHHGHCGDRRLCWRDTCREAFGRYRTIEVLAAGDVRAYCHGGTYHAGDIIARLVAV